MKNGFGLIGILVVIAVIALAGGGGFYWNETKKQQSFLQIGADAIKRTEELKKQIESRQEQIYGGRTSINSSAAPTSKNDILSSIPTIEQTKLFTIARSYVLSHSTSGIEFGIVPEKIINNCVKFSVIAKHRETDDAQLFIIKINGVWTPIAFGTAFPNLYFDHPECSESGISNWKTYRNEKYGFEVRYPDSSSVIEMSDKVIIKEKGSGENPTQTVSIQFLLQKDLFDFRSYYNKYIAESFDDECVSVTKNNLAAFKCFPSEYFPGEVFYFKRGDMIFEVGLLEHKFGNEIISTFKFTN